jgi:hypothetical protein
MDQVDEEVWENLWKNEEWRIQRGLEDENIVGVDEWNVQQNDDEAVSASHRYHGQYASIRAVVCIISLFSNGSTNAGHSRYAHERVRTIR